MPAATPLTRPAELTVAIAADELLHVPPLTASVSVTVPAVHNTGVAGNMAAGPTLTVTVLLTVHRPTV